MELKTSEDIDAPIEQVFGLLSDFDNLERLAARRGLEVERLSQGAVQEGMEWRVGYRLRGKDRSLDLRLTQLQPSTFMAVTGEGSGVSGQFGIELLALSPRCTRVSISVDLAASSLPGRLLLQSLKLARGKVEKRFKERVGRFTAVLEERLNDYA
ncbi:SRPBCC family protein [Epibacterium sp. SM1979]|uniref:SRPBCC family protein n=1 Tax=Tritonibacter litoralis TaxID=2662264 RepID=A0A843YHL3_9RHOB|nr:SRPBCC family protein [Tritonibacter litoralis]MQQ09165.1 SRPBCC family protein [Tritonibacter litoralis]